LVAFVKGLEETEAKSGLVCRSALFKKAGGGAMRRLLEARVPQPRIILTVLILALVSGSGFASEAELMPNVGRGSTLTAVTLVTLVLAAMVFGLSHWLERLRLRREAVDGDSAGPTNSENADEGRAIAPRLADVPDNPMLDALQAKQATIARSDPEDVSAADVTAKDDARFTHAAQ
jgi:hypothetical protein